MGRWDGVAVGCRSIQTWPADKQKKERKQCIPVCVIIVIIFVLDDGHKTRNSDWIMDE